MPSSSRKLSLPAARFQPVPCKVMTYLVDTDYIVDYLVGRTDVISFLHTLADKGSAISLSTQGEIYEGIYFGRDPQKGEDGFQRFFHFVDVLPLNTSNMQQFARIRGELRRGSGSFEDAGSFQVVAMEEEAQANFMHHQGF
jgi:predicted nucleic acid-binding protein